jgi:two-component system, sensor histidine kinase and response regulator
MVHTQQPLEPHHPTQFFPTVEAMYSNDYKGSVLIVDDTVQNLRLVAEILETEGYEIALATNGKQALEELDKQAFELVLLDVVMPELDGFAVCKVMKSTPALADIPVMFLTIHNELERVLKGFEIGAVDYITKPVHKAELLARVATHVELFKTKKRLEHQNKILMELHTERREFLNVMTHSLKTPLTGIRLSAEIIGQTVTREPVMKERVMEYSHQIELLVDRTTETIHHCLYADAIDEGIISSDPQRLDLVRCCREAIEQYDFMANAKRISIGLDVLDSEVAILADKNATREVLENLISNALKYSPTDTKVVVTVGRKTLADASATDELPQSRTAVVTVRDQGPGISEDDIKKMFGKYVRLTAKPTGGEHSTGLGLSIVKRLVDTMNGHVWCKSELGNGAAFIVEIPLASEA